MSDPIPRDAFTGDVSSDERRLEAALRPRTLDEFVGQDALRANLRVFISAARGRGEPVDHHLFCGPPGLGKTALAYVLAREMGATLRATSGPVLERPSDLAALLSNLDAGDVLFVDEIHRLHPAVEEILYPAMEDFHLDVVIGQGPSARSIRLDLPRFTLIGATTRAGLLTAPLRDRFGYVARLDYYPSADLVEILRRSSLRLGVEVDVDAADEIARRSRGTPRIALRLLRRVRDFAQVEASAGEPAARRATRRRAWSRCPTSSRAIALGRLEVDEEGFDRLDRAFLRTLLDKFDGGPVGVDALAAALGEDRGTRRGPPRAVPDAGRLPRPHAARPRRDDAGLGAFRQGPVAGRRATPSALRLARGSAARRAASPAHPRSTRPRALADTARAGLARPAQVGARSPRAGDTPIRLLGKGLILLAALALIGAGGVGLYLARGSNDDPRVRAGRKQVEQLGRRAGMESTRPTLEGNLPIVAMGVGGVLLLATMLAGRIRLPVARRRAVGEVAPRAERARRVAAPRSPLGAEGRTPGPCDGEEGAGPRGRGTLLRGRRARYRRRLLRRIRRLRARGRHPPRPESLPRGRRAAPEGGRQRNGRDDLRVAGRSQARCGMLLCRVADDRRGGALREGRRLPPRRQLLSRGRLRTAGRARVHSLPIVEGSRRGARSGDPRGAHADRHRAEPLARARGPDARAPGGQALRPGRRTRTRRERAREGRLSRRCGGGRAAPRPLREGRRALSRGQSARARGRSPAAERRGAGGRAHPRRVPPRARQRSGGCALSRGGRRVLRGRRRPPEARGFRAGRSGVREGRRSRAGRRHVPDRRQPGARGIELGEARALGRRSGVLGGSRRRAPSRERARQRRSPARGRRDLSPGRPGRRRHQGVAADSRRRRRLRGGLGDSRRRLPEPRASWDLRR